MFSIPSVAEKAALNRKTQLIHMWLKGWFYKRNFGFSYHRHIYAAPDLIRTGRVQLSQKGRGILTSESAKLTDQTLNLV